MPMDITQMRLFCSPDQCDTTIKCAVYEGVGKTAFKTRKEFSGSVLKQMDEAYEFISLKQPQHTTIEGLKRVDHRTIPPCALREALFKRDCASRTTTIPAAS